MVRKLKLLLSFVLGNRLRYIGAVLTLGLATIFAMIGPLILRFTIDSIIGAEPIGNLPSFVKSALHAVGGKSLLAQNLWALSSIFVVFALANGLFLFFKGKWSALASESIARNMRERLYEHLQYQPYNYHVKVKTGDLIQRCTSDVETIRHFLAVQFVEVGRAIFMIMSVVPIMLSLNVKMTLISMAVTPLLFLFGLIFFMKIKDAFKASDEAEGKMSTVLQENLTGVRVVRAFARQQYEITKFDQKNCDYRDFTYRLIVLMAWYWSISDFISLCQIGTVLLFGSIWAAKNIISLGTFVAFSSYVWMFLWPIRQMGRILADMGKTMVALERIQEVLDQPKESMSSNSIPENGTQLRPVIKGELEFDNVSFEYENGKPVLKNISFKARPGETIAILGPTGAGKSSLVHLLPALYDYNSGSIKIDGQELKTIDKKWLRKNVGIVLQEPFLFSKTVKDNIGLAKQDVKEEEIYEAAKVAAIHDVINDFEKGYDTAVGEKGVTLSGGQKQRVAISRTLVQECPILIFDDSLSAVDTETDASIRKALNNNGYKATTFIISHRLVTLSEADLILVLDNGELVQTGTHEQLISEQGLYQRLWNIQNDLEAELQQSEIL